jgi:hypothetical protein
MKKTGTQQATPRLRAQDQGMTARPWIDDFSAGYMQRMMHLMPKQGDHAPWINPQLIAVDKQMIVKSPIDDGAMQFTKAKALV